MAIEYRLFLDCPPRQVLGADPLWNRLWDRALADAAEARLGSTVPFPMEHIRDGRRITVEVTADSLRRAASVLDGHEAACRDCPANIGGGDFGCHGRIDFPIAEDAERWLMQLPADPGQHLMGHLLIGHIYDNELTGRPIAGLRGFGAFALREPVEREWPRSDGACLDSDKLLHVLIGVERRSPRESLGLLALLSLLKLDGERVADEDDLRLALRLVTDPEDRPEAPARLDFDLPLWVDRPPPSAAPWLEYLTALFAAALIGHEFHVTLRPPMRWPS